MSEKDSNDGDGVARRHQRRSRPVKNLQEEVDLILSQEDSDDNTKTSVHVEETKAAPQEKKLDTPLIHKKRSSAKRKARKTIDIDLEKSNKCDGDASTTEAAPKTPIKEINKDEVNELPTTPIEMEAELLPTTPSTSRILMTETPRRSARKSIRPPLDYDDIIEKKMLRSASKDTNDMENKDSESEPPQQKWTKAHVGGVSQSRGRKSKRSAAAKKRVIEEELPKENEIISKKRAKSTNSDNLSNDKEQEATTPTQQKKEAVSEVSSQKIIKKRNKSTNSEDLSNVKEKEAAIPTPKEESSQKVIKKRNTKSTTNSDDLSNNEEMKNEKPPKVEVERKEAPLIEVISEELLVVNEEEQLLIEESSSIQKESSDDQSENSDIQMKENKDDDLFDAVKNKETINLDSLEETQIETIEVPSTSNVSDEEFVEKLDENFGTYLKSNIIDLTELGLEPIPIIDAPSSIEMSPLFITDDDENCAGVKENDLNVTFDAEEESHVVDIDKLMETESMQLKGESNQMDDDNILMQTLQISDDEQEEDVKVKKPLTVSFKEQRNVTESMIKVVLTDPDEHNSTLLKCETTKLQPSTPKSSSSVLRNKPFRLPTPYKQKDSTPYKQKDPTPYKQRQTTPYKQKDVTPHKQRQTTPYKQKDVTPYKQNKENWDNFKIKSKMTPRSMYAMNNLTTLEPKDIVLRSIRKRSKSVSINPEPNSKGVTFYSPANQTLDIEELDKLMANNVKKQQVNDSYVTKRRKRSISLDDVRIQTQTSRIPKPIPPVTKFKSNTPNKIRPGTSQKVAVATTKPPTRTKMPNFAAIHQKTFNQMENLLEHVERKAERAKIFANSASKLRNASSQKLQTTPKRRLDGVSVITPLKREKSKASKKINMMSVFENVAKPEQNPFAITATKPDQQQLSLLISNLPKPRPMNNTEFKFNQTRSVTTTTTTTTTMTKTSKSIKKTTVSNSQTLKESNNRGVAPPPPMPESTATTTKVEKAQPPFNLSTQATSSKSSAYENKMAERRQRHIYMFKGRTATAKRAGGTTDTSNAEIIRGVRSNRRFELQMQHRKNVDQ